MRIKNVNFNTNMHTILDKLRHYLHNTNSQYFQKEPRDSGDYIMVQCPYHKQGQERRPSAQFRKSDGLFYCFNCKEAHSLVDVIYHCTGVNGLEWLRDNFDSSLIENRQLTLNIPNRNNNIPNKNNIIPYEDIAKYRRTHPYMFKRRLNMDTIRKFDIGYDENFILETKDEKGNIHKREIGECITFPVKDINGNILFIARRAIHTKFFNYPKNVDKPIYGLYEIYREMQHNKDISTIYICESMFNCCTVWTYGKYAVALNGTGSEEQLNMLKKTNFKRYIIALDPDNAGNIGSIKLRKALSNKSVSRLIIPKGKDINDLTKEEFDNLQESIFLTNEEQQFIK